jgi:hypothetical protein
VPDETTNEMRDLLREIRDLLLPVADAYRDQYERRRAAREAERLTSIRTIIQGSDARAKAWKLADGTRTQRSIAKEAGMDEGNASRFFKSLRQLEAISEATNPTRIVEV